MSRRRKADIPGFPESLRYTFDSSIVDRGNHFVYLCGCPRDHVPEIPQPEAVENLERSLCSMPDEGNTADPLEDINSSELEYLFKPRGVAVLGASGNPDKIGHLILKNIIAGGYEGRVFPVNLKTKQILGMEAFASVCEIEETVDIAILALPRKTILESIHQCGEAGVRFLVIITSGFSEVGNLA